MSCPLLVTSHHCRDRMAITRGGWTSRAMAAAATPRSMPSAPWPANHSSNTRRANVRNGTLEHRVGVGGCLGDQLDHVPVLDDLECSGSSHPCCSPTVRSNGYQSSSFCRSHQSP